MAIAIKTIPVLKDKAASDFSKKASCNTLAKHSVMFSEQVKIASKILVKAKI